MARRWIARSLLAVSLGLAAPVIADERRCPVPAGADPQLAEADPVARLRFIAGRLGRDAQRARVWAWSWAGAHSALVAYHLLQATALDPTRDGRIDGWIGVSTSGLALALLAVHPLPVLRDQRWLDAKLSDPFSYSVGGYQSGCATLAEAERRLVRDAAAESLGRSPLAHVVNFVFNIGIGVLLGAGFGHWEQAALAMLGGTAVAELQTITQPAGAVDALADYRAGRLARPLEQRDRGVSLLPAFAGGGGGVTVSLAW